MVMTIAICLDYNDDCEDNNDDNDDCHLQVIIGGALASPPAPDPPSSFRLEIS